MKLLPISILPVALISLASCTPKNTNQQPAVGQTTSAPIQQMQVGSPNQPIVPGHGKEVGLAYGAISGVGGTNANGIGMAHFLDDGTTVVNVQVNIAVADTGYSYEGWIQKADGSGKISLGLFTNPLKDARYTLMFATPNNLKDYNTISITREKDDSAAPSGDEVARATLKQTSH
jgi:hypothetical protein